LLAKPCDAWFIDAADKPLGRSLRVRSLPTMMPVSTDGGVFFKGHPDDERWWKAMREIDPDIVRSHAARDVGK
jgi:hypothetical protein